MTIMTVARTFTTVAVFENVRLKVPDMFKTEHQLPSTNIVVDEKVVPDVEHYYSGVILSGGKYLNRHYYFTAAPFPLGKSIVARVRVEVEKFPDGRKFTMLRIYAYAEPRRTEYELKIMAQGAEEGFPVEGSNAKIAFKKVEQRVVKATEAVAS